MAPNKVIPEQLEKYDSFYLYDERTIDAGLRRLKEHFPQVEFLYSVKCNPNPHVLHSVFSHGLGADAASAGEVALARQAGLSPDRIYFSAPGKSDGDIRSTLGRAVLIADSLNEISRINAVAAQNGTTVNIGIRVNPDCTFQGDGGQASKFGIDEAEALSFLAQNQCRNVRVNGIHVHLKSQELNADTLAVYYRRMFALAEKFAQVCGSLEYVNMGSGMGVPYTPDDAPLDMAALGAAFDKALAGYRERHPHTRIIIETGRYAVCASGLYVTKVLDRKVSHGKTYLILKNTLNGFIRPSLAQMVMKYSSSASPAGTEPLFTAKDAFAIRTLKDDAPSEVVTLVGNLCTGADVIAEDIRLPRLEIGDAVLLTNAGGYAAVLSPMQFSSQEQPRELFLTLSGEVLL